MIAIPIKKYSNIDCTFIYNLFGHGLQISAIGVANPAIGVDNDLANKKSGQFSEKLELSTLVEQRGIRSNYFDGDLEILNTISTNY